MTCPIKKRLSLVQKIILSTNIPFLKHSKGLVLCKKTYEMFHDTPLFFFFLTFQNQSAKENVIQLIKKEKPNDSASYLAYFQYWSTTKENAHDGTF